MEKLTDLKNMTYDALKLILNDIAAALPNILAAIVILLLGMLISKTVRFTLKKLFKLAKLQKVSDKINEAKLFGESELKVDIEKIFLGFVKWVLLLVFIIVAADILTLTVISSEIANLLRYLPILLSSLVIFIIGLYGAKLVKSALLSVFQSMGFSGSKLVSNIVFFIIVIFVTITSLNQAGIDTSLITNNFTLILGAFLLAFALAFGLGSRDVIASLLKTFYARKNYQVGDYIRVNGIEGTIESIDSIFMTLKTANGKQVLPIKDVVEQIVEVK